MAARAHRGPSPQHRAHVNHSAGADDGADIEDGPHHNHRALADFHLFTDDGAGLNAGGNVSGVKQGHAGISPVAFHHQIGNIRSILLQNGVKLRPVAEHGVASIGTEDLGRAKVHRIGGIHIDLHGGLFFGICDVVYNLLRVHWF
ncbi:hypothetical protein SDC9_211434 [bioreactor metagenome]|uniref:Uncharacterized protein n=1 Tax=bioreactor metagenome TaxID=1076179 RepID=A0A645JLR7_9ZZZZ